MPRQLPKVYWYNSPMAYYDSIANQWHQVTGYQGGAFKRYVLNDFLLAQIESIQDKAILELGAGNGYFMAWVAERLSGQIPNRLVISEISQVLLDMAVKNFQLAFAEYQLSDIRGRFDSPDETFDLVIATMVFNELTDAAARRGLAQVYRVMKGGGIFLMTVIHPDFIRNLDRRGMLRRDRQGLWTMPGAQNLYLPVVRRSRGKYEKLLEQAGFEWQAFDLFADERVLSEKAGLQAARSTPLGLVFRCAK